MPERAHSTLRTRSLGVQGSVRHRPYWEPWRSELRTPSGTLWSLGGQSFSRRRGLLRALAFKALYATDSPKHVGSATWSSWERWRRNCIRHWGVLGREPWREGCVRHCTIVGPALMFVVNSCAWQTMSRTDVQLKLLYVSDNVPRGLSSSCDL